MNLLKDLENELARIRSELQIDIANRERLQAEINQKMAFGSRLQDLIDKAKKELKQL